MLALDDAERKLAGQLLTDFLNGYERTLSESRLVPALDHDVLAALLAEPFPDKGIGVERLFAEITGTVVPNSTVVAHPRFLAYVLPTPNGIAPHAEAIAATLNQNCNFWQVSPAASVIERAVLTWLAGVVGLVGSDVGGIFTSGGSMATLNALTVALHDRRADFRRRGLQDSRRPLVVYTSEQAHRCVAKAVAILGLGVDNLRTIPTDESYRLRVELLRESIGNDRAAGREPFCVVATAGTVTTGAIDPLAEIADVCRAEDLWLHIDGAYGALFALSDRKRHEFAACARADSIALDPHKMLFAPLEAGCLIVRDASKLRAAYAFESSYLTGNDNPPMLNYMDYGPQLSRGFRAFKVWAALRLFGVHAFRDAIDHTLDMAGYLAERVDAAPNLRRMAPAPLTAVCFEVPGADHAALLNTLAEEGTALLGPVTLGGTTGIRACVANFRTTHADIDLIVDRLSLLSRTRNS